MFKTISKIALIIALIGMSNCLNAQLIRDTSRLSNIEKQLKVQKELAKNRANKLFNVFDLSLTSDEYQALKFLFAYMPLSDLADYDGQFFLDNIRMSLKAKNEMQWGKSIPEDVFLHFVLPVRVNNENLDSFRIIMYNELQARLKGLSMKDAALEVNHWCHEKVTYQGSDERTSSPLSSMRYSFGRCGEESTFTVAALRTAGIPARQVYTPRWAHSDDNHAWVEVWVDGKWYFLGACEPSPNLNMGWFAAPSTRTMLVHTRAYGWYVGSEPVITNQARYSELNLIENYAPAKKIVIKVIDSKSQPVANAKVEYQLYNYAEFFPLAKTFTSKNEGITSITTGLGDLLIWANKKTAFGYEKITVESVDTVVIKIENKVLSEKTEEFDFIPPVERELTKVSEEGQHENDKKLLYEDSIRMAYVATFKDSVWASRFAKEFELNVDSTIFYITHSYGNWMEIVNFLKDKPLSLRPYALRLLSVISEKDLRDTKAYILNDHLVRSMNYKSKFNGNEAIWEKYVLSGRIANEMMTDWKRVLRKSIASNKSTILRWEQIKNEVEGLIIDVDANAHSRAPLSPIGVSELKVTDLKSRDIFFVAVCRSNGIAARINPETLVPQVWENQRWEDVIFNQVQSEPIEKGFVHFKNASNFDPKYCTHFTIALFKDGVYRTLQFDENKPLSEFASSLEVPVGNYQLVTGNRQQDGAVLCRVYYFVVKAGETKEIEVKVRESQQVEKSWAKINTSEFILKSYQSNQKNTLSELVENKPFVIIFIDPDKEPSKHVMIDLQPVKAHFEKWGGALIFMLSSDKTTQAFKPEMFLGLPSQSMFAWDVENKLLNQISSLKSNKLSVDLPVIIVGDEKGNLSYFSKGYRIGVGEQLIKNLK